MLEVPSVISLSGNIPASESVHGGLFRTHVLNIQPTKHTDTSLYHEYHSCKACSLESAQYSVCIYIENQWKKQCAFLFNLILI